MNLPRVAILALLVASCTTTDDAPQSRAPQRSDGASRAAPATRRRMPDDAASASIPAVTAEPIPVSAVATSPVPDAPVAQTPAAPEAPPTVLPVEEPTPAPAPPAPSVPPAGPVVLGDVTLVRGDGAAPQPAAVDVAGHEMLPVWDDASGPRPPAVRLSWDASELVLNLYDRPRATPTQIEFSLDGGPWAVARYGRVIVPDLGPGTYQVRCVAYPPAGRSWVMDPVLLERTANGWRTVDAAASR